MLYEKMAADIDIQQKHAYPPNAKTKYVHSDIQRNANMTPHSDFKQNACTSTQKKNHEIH